MGLVIGEGISQDAHSGLVFNLVKTWSLQKKQSEGQYLIEAFHIFPHLSTFSVIQSDSDDATQSLRHALEEMC